MLLLQIYAGMPWTFQTQRKKTGSLAMLLRYSLPEQLHQAGVIKLELDCFTIEDHNLFLLNIKCGRKTRENITSSTECCNTFKTSSARELGPLEEK